MLKNIDGLNIHVKIIDQRFEMPDEIKQKIREFWKNVQKDNPNIWDGEIMCVGEYEVKKKDIFITCKKSNYSHYLYDERVGGLSKEYYCSSIAAACLLETSDGYFVVGELAENTSFPGCMQISGGSVDYKDIKKDEVDVFKTIVRECKEELNIDLKNKEQSEKFEIKYINLPDVAHQYIIIATAKLKMTKEEMGRHYEKYLNDLRKNNLEIEFGKIHFIQKGKSTEELSKFANPKRDYLLDLLQAESIS